MSRPIRTKCVDCGQIFGDDTDVGTGICDTCYIARKAASKQYREEHTRKRQPVWYEMTTIALGIPVVLWTLALVTVAVILLLCGCAGIENHDAYWNKAYLATPMGAVAE